jgi:hypothetical protein
MNGIIQKLKIGHEEEMGMGGCKEHVEHQAKDEESQLFLGADMVFDPEEIFRKHETA